MVCPVVCLVPSLELIWVWCQAFRLGFFRLNSNRSAKINNLDLIELLVLLQQYVLWLQVSVYNIVLMAIVNTWKNLFQQHCCITSCQSGLDPSLPPAAFKVSLHTLDFRHLHLYSANSFCRYASAVPLNSFSFSGGSFVKFTRLYQSKDFGPYLHTARN